MKKYFLIIVLLSSTFFYGQFSLNRPPVILNPGDKPPKDYVIGAYSFGCWKLHSGIQGGILMEKHAYFAGLGMDFSPFYGRFFQNWSLNLDYNYFPNGYKHRFDLLFYLNINFAFPYYEYKTYDANPVLIKTEHEIQDYQNYSAGIGFNLNLSQKIFMKFGNGLSLSINRYNIFQNEYLGYNLKLSVGYRL